MTTATPDIITLPTMIQNAFLAKCSEKLEQLEPGEHHIDMVVRIKGVLNQGEPYQKANVQKANLMTILLLAFSKMNNVTADSIAALVLEAFDAERDPEATSRIEDEAKKIKGYADAAMAKIAEATIQDYKGKLTGNVSAMVVSVLDQGFTPPDQASPVPSVSKSRKRTP